MGISLPDDCLPEDWLRLRSELDGLRVCARQAMCATNAELTENNVRSAFARLREDLQNRLLKKYTIKQLNNFAAYRWLIGHSIDKTPLPPYDLPGEVSVRAFLERIISNNSKPSPPASGPEPSRPEHGRDKGIVKNPASKNPAHR